MSYQLVTLPDNVSQLERELRADFLDRALQLDKALRLGNVKQWRTAGSLSHGGCTIACAKFCDCFGAQVAMEFTCDRAAIFTRFSESASLQTLTSVTQTDYEGPCGRVRTIELMSDGTLRWSEQGLTNTDFRNRISTSTNVQHWIVQMLTYLECV
jgi:hypothetical protein